MELQDEEKGGAVELRCRKGAARLRNVLPSCHESRNHGRSSVVEMPRPAPDHATGPDGDFDRRRRWMAGLGGRVTSCAVSGGDFDRRRRWVAGLGGRVTRATVYCTGSRSEAPKMWPPSLDGRAGAYLPVQQPVQ